MARRTDTDERDAGSSTGTLQFPVIDTGSDGDGGDANGSDRGGTETRRDESGETTLESQSSSDEAVVGVVIEAPETPKKRRGRRSKLEIERDGGLPVRTQNKRAEHYISILRDLWLDLHRLPAALIDEELQWTLDEATRFAECAYEVCVSRHWLALLERATEARLLVLILSIETEKIRKVLAKQQTRVPVRQMAPPPQIRTPQQNGQTPVNRNPDMPLFVAVNQMVQPGDE